MVIFVCVGYRMLQGISRPEQGLLPPHHHQGLGHHSLGPATHWPSSQPDDLPHKGNKLTGIKSQTAILAGGNSPGGLGASVDHSWLPKIILYFAINYVPTYVPLLCRMTANTDMIPTREDRCFITRC